ncbi:MAG: hypothetical protein KJZ85_18380 [Rhodobacteraceae bacterium]|jgi:hypothetical protein|nr:hypothetical protein [Paracoccaceae bacterium]
MTDRIAYVLAAVLALMLVADLVLFDWGASLLLARKVATLIDYLAFWR